MATTPNFAATPHVGPVLVSTANTNTDGTTGTRATVITAAANGTRVDSIKVKGITPTGSTQSADTVRIWINNGTNAFLFTETQIAAGAGNISATQGNVEANIPMGIDLPSGYSIQASTHVGSTTASYHVTAVGGDY